MAPRGKREFSRSVVGFPRDLLQGLSRGLAFFVHFRIFAVGVGPTLALFFLGGFERGARSAHSGERADLPLLGI